MFKCEKCLGWFTTDATDQRTAWRAAMLLGWREVNGMKFCPDCFRQRLPSERVSDRRTANRVPELQVLEDVGDEFRVWHDSGP